jgi:protein phosphatase 2C-like protein
VTWRTVAASDVGTSHSDRAEACEDECWAAAEDADGRPFLSIFVADGAGSASHGGEGARIAIEAAVAFVECRRREVCAEPSDALARGCFDAARSRLLSEADARGIRPRDLGCTFLGILSSQSRAAAVQIGDGAIVLDIGDGLTIPIEPMNGEFANATRFVVDDDAAEQVAVATFDRPIQRAAALSDGVQRIATNLATNTPHEPFFEPFFRTLGASEAADREDELQTALAAFLASEHVNARTDDDKTLALAVMLR